MSSQMSSSKDDSVIVDATEDEQDGEGDCDPSKDLSLKEDDRNKDNDVLLTIAFEDQMKLVERSIQEKPLNDLDGPSKKVKKKNKKAQPDQQHSFADSIPASPGNNKQNHKGQPEKQVKQQSKVQQQRNDDTRKHTDSNAIFTNRSRIYRYDATAANTTNHPLFSDNKNHSQGKPITIPPFDNHTKTFDGIISSGLLDGDDDDQIRQAREKMMMSWYLAGYNTGYYEAMKKYKKSAQ